MFASELEFYLYKQSYAQAHEQDYRDLTPTIPYILDYHILATTMDENVIGQIRRGMRGAGIPVEFSKGEAWYGQHELNVRYADAVTSADRHTIYKNGVKEIAFLNGVSATFMAKPSEKDIGSSCHIHSSLVDARSAASAFVNGHDETDVFRHYLGGARGRIRELALLIAPTVNSYKRYATESWAPTSISWGRDNRTVRLQDRRARAVAARRVPDPGRRRQPVPRVRGAAGSGARWDRQRDRSGAGADRQRLSRRDRPSRSRRRCARPSIYGRAASSRARRSASTSGPTTSTTGAPSSGCSTRS